ncbi:MAG TPA: hypothetical protein VE175_06380 [Woeseiaceae bacterium]|nr:hypothetical protein [Woeseiaceae bacterium]
MDFAALSGAGTAALASSSAVALLSVAGRSIVRAGRPASRFDAIIMPEPGQRARRDIVALERRQALFATTSIVFIAVFLSAYLLVPSSRFEGMPTWQIIVATAAGVAAIVWAAASLWRLTMARRRLAFVRDAGIVVGQGLQKLTGNQNRVFHDVPCGGLVLDNVVVGLHGIYAVYVIARRPGRHNKLRLRGDQLLFAPGDYRVALTPCIERSDLLARQLGKALKISLRVRTVIAVPGWEIEAQPGDACLIVNERNLVMLRGWKNADEYLMHEDVKRLEELLTDRCTRYGRQPEKSPVSFLVTPRTV